MKVFGILLFLSPAVKACPSGCCALQEGCTVSSGLTLKNTDFDLKICYGYAVFEIENSIPNLCSNILACIRQNLRENAIRKVLRATQLYISSVPKVQLQS